MKIGIAFSAGGHYIEAMKACKLIMNDLENQYFFLTYKQIDRNDSYNKYYFVTHPKHGFVFTRILQFLKNFIESFIVYLKERPDVVVSTGADVTVSIMLIAKVFSKKVIFIESGANVTKPSLTGKIVYKFSDVFIIQWPELKKIYPKAIIGIPLL